MPFQPTSGLFMEMIRLCQSEDTARQYLQQNGILRSTIQCSSCNQTMIPRPCSSTKSADLWIFKCGGSGCKRTKSIRSASYLESSQLSFTTFLMLVMCFSSKNLTDVDIAAFTGISRAAVNNWRNTLMEAVTVWIVNHPLPIGGPGLIVEIDECMFGKMKYGRGALRQGVWVIGGVCRNTGHCFLIPCPGNRRSADVLIPLITRNVLPGSIVHTDQWAAYNQLTFTATGYTHLTVNHSVNFVDPLTGCHTNTQEGMWHHVKRRMDGHQKLESIFVDFMFRRRFEANSGVCQIRNCFNAYLTVLKYN